MRDLKLKAMLRYLSYFVSEGVELKILFSFVRFSQII